MLSRRLLRIKVVKALYAHFKSENDSIAASEKALLFSIDKTYSLYHQVFTLILDVQSYATERLEAAKHKMIPTKEDLNPNLKFINNPVIKQIADCEALEHYCTVNALGWANYPELIKKIYNDLIQRPFYKDYMNATEESYAADKQFVINLFENLEDCELLDDVLLEQSIFWDDDLNFVLIMIVKTVGAMKCDAPLKLMPKYKNDQDEAYVKELFRKSLLCSAEYLKLIDEFTKNWEIERIAYMDQVIMLTAVAEIMNFPSIPIKVSLDEFIEISKFYSTPTSSTFINGVLDHVVANLTSENKITKAGRGLMNSGKN